MSRSDNLYDTLMNQTVLADFFKPVVTALTKVNARVSNATALPMKIYLLVSCMRHLHQGLIVCARSSIYPHELLG